MRKMMKKAVIIFMVFFMIAGITEAQEQEGQSMANYREDIVNIDLECGTLHRSFLQHAIGEGDELANRFGVRVFREKTPVQLVGTCSGYFIRADGATVPLTNGVITGNVAYVTLTENCYAVEGVFALAIKITNGSEKVTLRIVDGIVSRTSTDAAVDPGTIIPSVEALIEAIDEAVASIPLDYSELSQAAVKGNYVWNASKLSTYATADALPVQSCFIGNFGAEDYDTLNLPSRLTYQIDPSIFKVETVGTAGYKTQIATYGHTNTAKAFIRMCVSGTWDDWTILSDGKYIDNQGFVWNASKLSTYATADALPMQSVFIGNFSGSDYDDLHLPSRTIYKLDASLFIVETYGNTTFAVQTATFGNSASAKQFIRTRVSGTWNAWKLMTGEAVYTIDKGGSGSNTSLVEGIIEAYEAGIKNIAVMPGEYDMIEEYQAIYGSSWEAGFLASGYASGLPIGNGMILNFAPGAVVTFDYSEGRNADINERASAFMAKAGDYEIYGLDISCKNIRYCIHDELAGVGSYRHVYENCKMSMTDDENTAWKSCQCIGGGLGKSANIEIRNCIFYSDNDGDNTGVGAVSYHNGEYADIKSFISITGCYFDGNNGTFRASWYGLSTLITEIIATNNSLKIAPIFRAETAGSTIENMELIAFNNVIR